MGLNDSGIVGLSMNGVVKLLQYEWAVKIALVFNELLNYEGSKCQNYYVA